MLTRSTFLGTLASILWAASIFLDFLWFSWDKIYWVRGNLYLLTPCEYGCRPKISFFLPASPFPWGKCFWFRFLFAEIGQYFLCLLFLSPFCLSLFLNLCIFCQPHLHQVQATSVSLYTPESLKLTFPIQNFYVEGISNPKIQSSSAPYSRKHYGAQLNLIDFFLNSLISF